MKLTNKEKQVLWDQIGQNIEQYRSKLDITQSELAQKAGFSLLFIGLIERGKRPAPVATLASIAEALKVKVADLLKGV
jgi:transcriptional regulator with XRE-family HTH domain